MNNRFHERTVLPHNLSVSNEGDKSNFEVSSHDAVECTLVLFVKVVEDDLLFCSYRYLCS